MVEYEHGSMDVSANEKEFAGFVRFAVWVCVAAILVLIFLAIFNS
ncbi:MAG: aa3-type cytochrome c oxidase subunit IV [Rhodobacteraceae bacterium]|nr:aa3-type cytochrome c oxidase subunit IV [Paracoccaceae bacterium]